MSFEITLSPAGRLAVERVPELTPAVDEKWLARIDTAFESSSEEGLVFLAGEAGGIALPPSPGYWRDFARLYLQRLCQTSGAAEGAAPVLPVPGAEELEAFVQQAPPMRGGEFLTAELLGKLWRAVGDFIHQQTVTEGFATWLKSFGAQWHAVGRVTFHLAENKRDPERPFAFLATYVHRLSEQGKPQHLPLSKALQEYAGTERKAELANLLEPVRRAGEKSAFVRELLESRRIFQPLAWPPGTAYRLLKDIPLLEESGILVRLPDWWKSGRPARAQVKVRIGDQRSTTFGLDSLLDFSVEIALDGEPLTEEEWRQITTSEENLILLKGKWVEVDHDRLKQVLDQWKKVKKHGGEISFLEGMRMLSGLGREGQADDPLAEPELREWSQVVPGDWLCETLSAMRNPSTIGGFDPGRGLRASLRPYQETGVHWLWFMTSLGLGACLADDMGLGKTLQTIALLVQIKRESPADGRAAHPSLLVAPASLLANWKNEISRFAPELSVYFAHPSETSAAKLKEAVADPAKAFRGKDLVVTTYSLLTRLDWLRELDWRLVVLDEAQAIKNPGSRQTRAVKQLRARARVALTGTPVENRLGDLWSLFDFLCPGLLGSAKEFGRTVKRLAEDKNHHFAPLRQLTQPYILRRLKTDRRVIADLPDKTELTAWCTLSKAQAVLYENSVGELAKKLKDAESIQRRGLILAFLVRFKQICNHPSHWLGDEAWEPSASGKFMRVRELAEKGQSLDPVCIEGRGIAQSFWGKAWCKNLESYSDYASRLPRGRSYVRNGCVIDLQIEECCVKALVSGTELYKVSIKIEPVRVAQWKNLKAECAGEIGSLIDLLQGKLSGKVMEIMTRRGSGLFPAPSEIRFKCSCPDSAYLCKHIAATLYGVGARLDEQPKLLFVLRDADYREFITQAADSIAAAPAEGETGADVLAEGDLASVFGIELDGAAEVETSKVAEAAPVKAAPQKSAKARTAPGAKKTPKRKAPAASAAARKTKTKAAQKPAKETTRKVKRF